VPDPLAHARLPPDFTPDTPLLAGISGGRDSVALLHWLVSRGFLKVIVCHMDHALRAGSRDDARFVKKLAAGLGCAFVGGRVNVALLARRRKLSLEAAAREARFAFFAKCARTYKTGRLILAHHADDQVETFLFNLLRGAGPGGLGGMAPLTVRTDGLAVARPFIEVWRKEIDAYAAAHGLAFREDPSNSDPRHTRNRLRHEILPALSTAMGRDVRRALWRTARMLRAEDDYLAAQTPAPTAQLAVKELRALPPALQRRVIHAWLRAAGVREVGYDEVETVRTLLDGTRAKVNLARGRCARRRAGRIFLDSQ
jgi:tRNA(Ile)-lysidine synthase